MNSPASPSIVKGEIAATGNGEGAALFERKQRLYPNTIRVMNRLIQAPASVKALSEELHMDKTSVQWAIDTLRRMNLVHVTRYIRAPRGNPARIWAAGKGEDAERPDRKPSAERLKEWRAAGGDSHRARTIQRQAKRIVKSMTMAGMLGV